MTDTLRSGSEIKRQTMPRESFFSLILAAVTLAVAWPQLCSAKIQSDQKTPPKIDHSAGGIFTSGLPKTEKTESSESSSAQAEFDKTKTDPTLSNSTRLTYTDPIISRWKAGVRLTGGAADSYNIYITLPVPNDWPEQSVSVVQEDIPIKAQVVTYRILDNGLKQMLIKLPNLPARETLELTTTFRVVTCQIDGPSVTDDLVRPGSDDRNLNDYLGSSPSITFNDRKLKEKLTEIVQEKSSLWEEIRAIYDWVRDEIEQREMANVDSIKAFKQGYGSEEDKISLFIALCRAHRVPARVVWVDGSSYAEFCLADDAGDLHWFPANVAGLREFGCYSEPRVILQKGDNIKVPEKSQRQRFVAEYVSAKGRSGAAKPIVEFIRELLPND